MEWAPASMNPCRYDGEGSFTMRWTSRGIFVLIFFTNFASTVVGGTNLPSMISTWIRSDHFSTCLISLLILLESAERMEGDILRRGLLGEALFLDVMGMIPLQLR